MLESVTHNKGSEVVLKAIKLIALATLTYLMILALYMMLKELTLFWEERTFYILDYFWMQPIHIDMSRDDFLRAALGAATENGEYYFVYLFLIVSGVLFIIALFSMAEYRIVQLFKGVYKADKMDAIYRQILPLICWILAWLSLNEINSNFAFEQYIKTEILINVYKNESIYTTVTSSFFILSFMVSLLYVAKTLYYAFFINCEKMIGIMKRKALGE